MQPKQPGFFIAHLVSPTQDAIVTTWMTHYIFGYPGIPINTFTCQLLGAGVRSKMIQEIFHTVEKSHRLDVKKPCKSWDINYQPQLVLLAGFLVAINSINLLPDFWASSIFPWKHQEVGWLGGREVIQMIQVTQVETFLGLQECFFFVRSTMLQASFHPHCSLFPGKSPIKTVFVTFLFFDARTMG